MACALTTTDNPWSPFTQFDEWYKCDEIELGHHTCGYLAQFAHTSPAFSDDLNERIIEDAIDEIVKFDILGIISAGKEHYIKVTAPDDNRTEDIDRLLVQMG